MGRKQSFGQKEAKRIIRQGWVKASFKRICLDCLSGGGEKCPGGEG